MRSFVALQGGSKSFVGGWHAVTRWASHQVSDNASPVKIIRARAGDKYGKIVAEITREGLRRIPNGRQVAVRGRYGGP